ncbi:anti-anti-sigma factor [Motilibacter peucedani]|uniref:Anti-anti-sigma factor n=1 Tax=Motilibacter peucedani TaxID=598650 RepID=A0A420XLD4_9ACTN|nr:STAS domain-containing protein [Motilibacter peucedani]RKS71344.1 anti-anti-sigma factor [Motilibacter peucedani]
MAWTTLCDLALPDDDLVELSRFVVPASRRDRSLVLDDAQDVSAARLSETAEALPLWVDDRPADLDVSVEDGDEKVTVHVRGELDLATSGLLDAVLSDCLRGRRGRRTDVLAVDTSGVGFVDASGVSPLLHARAVLNRRGGELRLEAPSTAVRRLLVLLGLEELLPPVAPA